MTDELTVASTSTAHDRAPPLRLRRIAAALTAALALAACAREVVPPAAPFGGTLAAPLPHRDILGFLAVDPADTAWIAQQELKFGRVDLAQTSIVAPLLCMLRLVHDHPFVPKGSSFALLFLDTDVHGGVAAYAWRGDAASLRAAAQAAQIPCDDDGRLLLPGRGRARDVDLWTDALRDRARGNDDAPVARELVMPDASTRRPSDAETRRPTVPRIPHWIVERDGVVLVLPAADGERNVFDTLATTRMLDVEPVRLPCLRIAIGRVNARFRGVAGGALDFAVDRMFQMDWSHFDESIWRARTRAFRVCEALLDAACSVDEIFVERDGGGWQAFVRQRPGSFGAQLLDVVVNRPVADLLADVPAAAECVAGCFDPAAALRLPDTSQSTRAAFARRLGGELRGRNSLFADTSDAEKEAEVARTFFAGVTGRFWIAGALDAAHTNLRGARGGETFKAEAIGATQLATFFEGRPGADSVGLFTTLVDTLAPKAWRNPIRFGSALVYRPAPLDNGVLEIVAQDPDRVRRETIASIRDGGAKPADGAPAEAFLVQRAEKETGGPLAGDLYATRVGLGIALRFVPAVP